MLGAAQGIKSARLPIREHLQLTGTHVLTVNQVMALLLEYQHCHDWKQAVLAIMPGRKHAHEQAHPAAQAGLACDISRTAQSTQPHGPSPKKQKLADDSEQL